NTFVAGDAPVEAITQSAISRSGEDCAGVRGVARDDPRRNEQLITDPSPPRIFDGSLAADRLAYASRSPWYDSRPSIIRAAEVKGCGSVLPPAAMWVTTCSRAFR